MYLDYVYRQSCTDTELKDICDSKNLFSVMIRILFCNIKTIIEHIEIWAKGIQFVNNQSVWI